MFSRSCSLLACASSIFILACGVHTLRLILLFLFKFADLTLLYTLSLLALTLSFRSAFPKCPPIEGFHIDLLFLNSLKAKTKNHSSNRL